MQLFTIIASLTVAASCVSGMPTEQLPKREVGGVCRQSFLPLPLCAFTYAEAQF